jgi:hypothetical protein
MNKKRISKQKRIKEGKDSDDETGLQRALSVLFRVKKRYLI